MIQRSVCKFRNFRISSGRLGEGRFEDDSGDPRRRHHAQSARLHLGRPLHHLQPAHRPDRGKGPRRVHVPDQHGSDDVPGRLLSRRDVIRDKMDRVQRKLRAESCTYNDVRALPDRRRTST